MYKFSRKQAITLLNSDDFLDGFEKNFEQIGRGWVIFFRGNPVKPIRGNNHFYASYDAALQGIDRNVNISDEVKRSLAVSVYGFAHDSDEWRIYFRHDLRKRLSDERRSKFNAYIIAEKLTDEEKVIFDITWDEEEKFKSFCYNALKSVIIPKWIEQGILEIKYV